jgi:hypothetical protein
MASSQAGGANTGVNGGKFFLVLSDRGYMAQDCEDGLKRLYGTIKEQLRIAPLPSRG